MNRLDNHIMRLKIALAVLITALAVTLSNNTRESVTYKAAMPAYKYTYVKIIETAARTYNLPTSLIAAIIKAESGFNPKAVSSQGAIGLMQLGLSTRQAMKVTNPFDPLQNILAGAKYLRQLLDRFDGNLHMAIAAYNAGPTAVERHGGIPPYSQTRRYVPKVMEYYNQFESEIAID